MAAKSSINFMASGFLVQARLEFFWVYSRIRTISDLFLFPVPIFEALSGNDSCFVTMLLPICRLGGALDLKESVVVTIGAAIFGACKFREEIGAVFS